ARSRVATLDLDLEARALHREVGQLPQDGLRELGRRLASRGTERCRALVRIRPRFRKLAVERLERRACVLEQRQLRTAVLRVLEHGCEGPAVLALEPLVQLKPLLDLLQPPGLGVEPALVTAQLG